MSAVEFLAEVKRVVEAATPGPWGHYTPRGKGYPNYDPVFGEKPGDEVAMVKRIADHRFIARARADVPRLVAALEAVLGIVEPAVNDTRGLPAFAAGERGMATAVWIAVEAALAAEEEGEGDAH